MSQFNFGPAEKQIPNFAGATANDNGSRGLVPAPASGDNDKFLKGDGTWDNVPNPSINENDLVIIERTDYASQAISKGAYVQWNGKLRTAKDAILQGAELSASLFDDADSDGGALNGIVTKVSALSDHLAQLLKESDLGTYAVKVQFGNNKQGPSSTASYRTPIPFLVRNGNYTVTINSVTVNGYTTVDKSLVSAAYEASGGWNFATTSDYVAGRMATISITVEEATT